MFAIDLLKNVFKRPAAASRRQRRVRTLLAVESLEAREVLTLSPVPYNAGYPFTSIVELQATFPDHTTMYGSGVMVDRFHVLTAGHIVYEYANGGFASQIVAFGRVFATLSRSSLGCGPGFAGAPPRGVRFKAIFRNHSWIRPVDIGCFNADVGTLLRMVPQGREWRWLRLRLFDLLAVLSAHYETGGHAEHENQQAQQHE